MIEHSRMDEYRNCLKFATELAKIHDRVFYVYDMDGTFQCTPTMDDTGRELAGRAWPGGRIEAIALRSPKGGLLR